MALLLLDGYRCLVTGGGSGIGRAIVLAFSRAGAHVVAAGRRSAALDETVRLANGLPGRVSGVVMDVCDRRATEAAVQCAIESLGGEIEVLVNNAGVGGPNACGGDGPDRWEDIVRPNLDGVFYVTNAALARVREGGRVINISSVLGKFGVPGYTAYCASKHGVIGFTKALAHELAPRRITVNAICPGWVDTDMARTGMEHMARGRRITFDAAREQALSQVPLGRMIEPTEVADLVAYVASPAAAAMTGQAISLCGGSTMG